LPGADARARLAGTLMSRESLPDEVVMATKWFQVVAKHPPEWSEPHYSIQTSDYVAVVAVDEAGQFLLVRQLRPAVGGMTIEIPSGHVDGDESPAEAARRELLEETGYVADEFVGVANLSPDTGRLGNRMWCFFAGNARRSPDPSHAGEAGVDFVLYPGGLRALIAEKEFCSALNYAALFACVLAGRLRWD